MIAKRPSISNRSHNASARKVYQDFTLHTKNAKPFANHQNIDSYKISYGTPVKSARNPMGTIRNYEEKQMKYHEIQSKQPYPSSNFKYSQNQDYQSQHNLQLNQTKNPSIRLSQKIGQNQQRVSHNYYDKNHPRFPQKALQNNQQRYPNYNQRPSARSKNEYSTFDKLQCQKVTNQQSFPPNCYYNDRKQLSDITGTKTNLLSQKNADKRPWNPRQSQVEKNNFMRSRQNRKEFLKQAQEKLLCYNQQLQSGKSPNDIHFVQERKPEIVRNGFNQIKVAYKNSQLSGQKRQYTPQKIRRGDGQNQRCVPTKRSSMIFPQNNQYCKMTPREKSAVLRQQLQKSRNITTKGYNFHNPINSSKQMNRSVDQITIKNALNFENKRGLTTNSEVPRHQKNDINMYTGMVRHQKVNDTGSNNMSKPINSSFCVSRNKAVDYEENSFISVFQKGLGIENQKTIGKLKKINELNQKINQRIKKIIDNFENKSLQ